MQNVRTGYLITGTGDAGVVFADTLPGLSDAHITIVIGLASRAATETRLIFLSRCTVAALCLVMCTKGHTSTQKCRRCRPVFAQWACWLETTLHRKTQQPSSTNLIIIRNYR
jgi:hypothetical protein